MTTPSRTAAHARPGWLELLASRDFRFMLLTTFGMDVGYYLRIAAQSWLVLELTDQALWVGLVNGIRLIPVLGLSLLGGVLTDRFDPRRILFIVRAGLALIVLAAGWIVYAGDVRPWHLIVISLAIGTVISFGSPAYYSFMFDLAGRARIWVANSMAAVVSNAGAIAGPAIAGVVLTSTGADAVFFIASVMYLSGAVGILFINSRPPRETAVRGQIRTELSAGLRYVRETPHIMWLLVISLTTLAHSAVYPLFPVYARDVLNTGAAGYGLLTGAFGVGLFAGAVMLALLPDVKHRGVAVLLATVAWDVAMVVFGVSRSFPLSLSMAAVMGFSGAYWGNALVTMLQTMATDDMRGRVMSVFSITAEFSALGWLAGGALAQALGNEVALYIAAAAGTGVTVVAFIASPVIRRS